MQPKVFHKSNLIEYGRSYGCLKLLLKVCITNSTSGEEKVLFCDENIGIYQFKMRIKASSVMLSKVLGHLNVQKYIMIKYFALSW